MAQNSEEYTTHARVKSEAYLEQEDTAARGQSDLPTALGEPIGSKDAHVLEEKRGEKSSVARLLGWDVLNSEAGCRERRILK
uniref:Uncharacterized protein n=1 Tax=Knipowitschia caucasica TaxID=637954 RepID=A0AAV2MCW5_KNICA